jgi:hypothetical protein
VDERHEGDLRELLREPSDGLVRRADRHPPALVDARTPLLLARPASAARQQHERDRAEGDHPGDPAVHGTLAVGGSKSGSSIG